MSENQSRVEWVQQERWLWSWGVGWVGDVWPLVPFSQLAAQWLGSEGRGGLVSIRVELYEYLVSRQDPQPPHITTCNPGRPPPTPLPAVICPL